MLNILNIKLKKNMPKKTFFCEQKKGDYAGETKHFPPANKEWYNSIYAFNKNTQKSIPAADRFILALINSYFNLYSRMFERKIRARRLRLWVKRLSTNKILLSRAELKHTSDKVIITLFVYNRQKKYLENKIRKVASLGSYDNLKFSQKMSCLRLKALKIISKIRKEKGLLIDALKVKKNNFIRSLVKNYSLDFLKKSLEREMLYMYFKQVITFNKLKFGDAYLLPLKGLIEKVYNKKVEFNLVNVKYFHLNSDILSGILALKLRNRKNRVFRVLKASLVKVKLPSLDKLALFEEIYNRKRTRQNLGVGYLKENFEKTNNSDVISRVLGDFLKVHVDESDNSASDISVNMENTVLDSIKHKYISGIRIEASGRLSKRYTAARTVNKVKYLGNLRNIDSSYKGFSSVILRGNLRSNLQFTKLKNKTRIGAFGLKGWVSSI